MTFLVRTPMPPSPPETRASLILRLPNMADVAAWEEFVAIYGPLVFRTARLQGLQPADAEDVVQEVLSSVARSVTPWLERDDRGPFRAWLFRIARNTTINHLTRRRTRSMASEPLSEAGEAIAVNKPLSDLFDLEHRRQLFLQAAEIVKTTVTGSTWQAFWKTHVEDQSPADVARELGMTSGSVYIARSRVMARLRETIRELEGIAKQ
ncbi:MAG: sigma-70 family RNA polymerase sigma factor [Planctomycetaceae bacterium]|nr:sigma-70 family RNA polymerase sigma factor [Planctomycetaceae bacterium]